MYAGTCPSFEHREIRWHPHINTSSSCHVPDFLHTTPHSLFSKNSLKDWICLLLSLPLFRNFNFSSLCLCLLLQNHYTNLLCLSLAHSSPRSQKANEIPLYQRYDQGPPMRGCENPEDKWVMSPLRYSFKDIRARCLWVPGSVEGFKILKKMADMRFEILTRCGAS
jgi:hypothetical protein